MTPGQLARRATVGAAALSLLMPMLSTTPAAADDATGKNCPDIHVLAVEGTDQPTVNAPTGNDTGELAGVIVPVVNAANKNGYKLERTYITYPADGGNGLTAAYKTSVLDGYHRLADVAARVVYQCPATKLAVLGYAQGGQAVSMWAQQVAAGKTEQVTPDQVALVTTFGDPTRAADAPLFVARPGQVGPAPWPGLDQKKNPSVTKFADMYTPPTGEGIGPERDIAADFGKLDGRVAQWCLGGDLSCSAPKSISLARAALGIAAQSSLDFTHDPFGVAATLASATANTLATGAATFADKDIQGKNLADAYFAPGASISKRLADASDPTNPDQQTNPLVGLLKMGQIVMSSVTSFIGQVLNPATLGSLLSAGVQIATSAATGAVTAGLPALGGGPAAAAAAAAAGAAAGATTALPSLAAPVISLAGSAATAALNVLPPQSADQKVSSVFDLLTNEVAANQDLPALLLDARLWNQTTHGAYRSTRVAVDGSTPADITADWIIAAGRDYHTAQIAVLNKGRDKTPPTKNPAATSPVATYDRDSAGTVIAPVNDRPDLNAAAKTATNGDVRLFTAPPPVAPAPGSATTPAEPVTWLADGTAPLAQRLVARAAQDGPAASLLRSGSPVLAALTATITEAQK